MNVAQVSLQIALQAKPTWSGVGTNTVGSPLVTDALLARSGESFAGGTLWALGATLPVVYQVQSHNNTTIVLTAPSVDMQTDPDGDPMPISSYIVSPIPFPELLRTINTALSSEKEMMFEEIAIDDTLLPTEYILTDAVDIRRVEIVPTSGTTTIHHAWREDPGKVVFRKLTPSVAGKLRVWYPANVAIRTSATDTMPINLRLETFISNCLQLIYRMGIQKIGKDGPSNYDLINEAKDKQDRVAMKGLSHATTLMDYDVRFRV